MPQSLSGTGFERNPAKLPVQLVQGARDGGWGRGGVQWACSSSFGHWVALVEHEQPTSPVQLARAGAAIGGLLLLEAPTPVVLVQAVEPGYHSSALRGPPLDQEIGQVPLRAFLGQAVAGAGVVPQQQGGRLQGLLSCVFCKPDGE